MSNEGLLNPEEVEFLLGGGEDDGADAVIDTGTQEVTMRGDLDQINLADIFQTLGMSKMEGVLRVRNPLEQRDIFFADGRAKCLVPGRVETRRLGQVLIKAGYITAEQLRAALLTQKKTQEPIGRILIEEGHIGEDTLEELALRQVTEDLFALFTWKHGHFEFYKGPCSDTMLQARLDSLPSFDVNNILLEVARRSDEWDSILSVVGSLDEIFAIDPRVPPAGPGESHQSVLECADGTQTVRDLGNSSMLGLFEGARAVRDLVEEGVLRHATTEELLQVADTWIAQGDNRRALVTIQTLYDRDDDKTTETVQHMAEVLQRCGESRLAGELLLEVAQSTFDVELALELGEQARRLCSRNSEILGFLLGQYEELGERSHHEQVQTRQELVDVLIDDGFLDEAFEHIERLEAAGAGRIPVLSRRATVLQKKQDTAGAIAAYDELGKEFAARNDHKRLGETYERILKLDADRKDVAKALLQLRKGRLAAYYLHIAVAVAVLLAAGAGWWLWQSHLRAQEVEALADRAQELINADKVLEAERLVAGRAGELEGAEGFAGLRKRVETKASSLRAAREREHAVALNEELAVAAGTLAEGRIQEALGQYDELRQVPGDRPEVRSAIEARFAALRDHLGELHRTLPHEIPDAPTRLTRREEIADAIAGLKEHFDGSLLRTLEFFEGAGENELFAELVPGGLQDELVGTAADVRAVFAQGMERLAQYEKAEQAAAVAERYNPLFVAARQHEAEYEFEKALELYRQLARAEHMQPRLQAHFKEQMERYSSIVRFLELQRKATREGDFEVARSHLEALKRAWQDIPFDRLLELPLWVESQPGAARIVVDGEEQGRTPALLSYVPAAETELRLELEGFDPLETRITGDRVGRVTSLLARTADWRQRLPGALDRTPLIDERDTAYVPDRGGNLSAVDVTGGKIRWSFASGDLSGLLTTPVRGGERLFIGSIDGPVRCLDRRTGTVLWEKDGYPTQVRPALCDNLLVVATTDGRLAALGAAGGDEVFEIGLAAEVQADLLSLGRDVLVLDVRGVAQRVHCSQAEVLWRTELGRGGLAAPLRTPRGVLCATEDGVLSMLDERSGRVAWSRTGLGETTLTPAVQGHRLAVSHFQGVDLFRLDDGEPLGRIEREGVTTSPAFVGNLLVFGTRDGTAYLADVAEQRVLYRLVTPSTLRAAPVIGSQERIVLCSEDRSMLGFRPHR